MNKIIKTYLKEIKALIPLRGKKEKLFLSDLKASAAEYAEEHPNCTYEQLCGALGHPGEIASDYLTGLEPDELRKKLRLMRTVRIAAVCVVTLAIIFFAFRSGLAYSSYLAGKDAVITKEIVTIQ